MARVFHTASASVPSNIATLDGHLSGWVKFEKGLTPPPFHLVHDANNGVVQVVFEKDTQISKCMCSIKCVFEEAEIGAFCPEDTDYIATFVEQNFIDTDPTVLIFQFTDNLGNISELTVNSLVRVVPLPPSLDGAGSTVYVGISLMSRGFVDLTEAISQVQIERYVNNPANKSILVDWTDVPLGTVADRRAVPGVPHGYRVRFRTTYDNPTPWSNWATTTPAATITPYFTYGGISQEFYIGESVSIIPEGAGEFTYFEEVD